MGVRVHRVALAILFPLIGLAELGVRYGKIAASMRGIEVSPAMVSFPVRVNKPTGWVQVAASPKSVYWLAPDAMLVTACSLTGIQRALKLAGIQPEGVVFKKGKKGPFEFEVWERGRKVEIYDLFELPQGDVVRVRDLVFVGASKLTRMVLREMELGLCAICPLRERHLPLIYAEFMRPSGEAGFVLKEGVPLRRGKLVKVVLRRR